MSTNCTTGWLSRSLCALLCLVLASCDKPEVQQARKPRPADDKTISAAGLLPASVGGTGFVALSAAESGIDFLNKITDVGILAEEANAQAGLACGDYDADGDLDVYLLGINAANKLYRNDGGLKFADVTAEAGDGLDGGEAYGSSAVFADLNGDDALDLYVVNRRGANELFLGDGKGRFNREDGARGLGTDRASVASAVFDADNDGDLDVYVANYRHDNNAQPLMEAHRLALLGGALPWYGNERLRPEVGKSPRAGAQLDPELAALFYIDDSGMARLRPHKDQFYLNDGRGNFTDATAAAGLEFEGWSFQPQACDFNNDGWTDLFVSSDFETPDRLFLNNQDGTFSDRTSELLRKTALFGMGADSGDLNHDGEMDLFVGDMLSPAYKRAKIQSGDMYQWRWELVNGDPQPQMRNMLYVNRGGGWMTEAAQMTGAAATEWTWAVRIADFNCDGMTDLFASNGMLRDSMDVDARAGLNKLIEQNRPVEEVAAYWMGLPDYFTDDVFLAAEKPLKYKQPEDNWGMHDAAMSCGAVLDDFDGDGDVDIIVNNTDKPAVVWRNDVASGNRVTIDLRQPGANSQAAGARVWAHCGEQVFAQDVILCRGFATGESSRVHLGLGEHATIDLLDVRWPDNTVQSYEMLPANKHYTITREKRPGKWSPPAAPKALFAQRGTGVTLPEQNTFEAEYAAEPLLPLQQSTWGPGASVADFDGDGAVEAYLCGPAGADGGLYAVDADATSARLTPAAHPPAALPTSAEKMAALAFDANADNRTDLVVTCGGMEGREGSDDYGSWLLLNGEDGYTSVRLPVPPVSIGAACAADLDGNGTLDLVLCGHVKRHQFAREERSFVLAGDGKGGFSEATARLAPGIVGGGQISDAQAADFNGDGAVDLLLARRWGAVELWLQEDGALRKAADAAPTGWWNSLGVGDFDNDGDLDCIAGNVGDDTKYHPKPGKPVTVIAADFDNSGSRDLIEIKYRDDGEMLPGRGRSCSGYAINYIPERFPTWHSFADATVKDVYGAGLDKAERFDAESIKSVVCLNDGKGNFTAADLPGTAQWAPAFGVGVGDFNLDGNLDAFIANNCRTPQCEAGMWDTGYGVLLAGDGSGGFTDLSRAESGISIHKCARGVVPADLNGDGLLDLLVSISDGETQVALGQRDAAGDGRGLAATLRGKAPNTGAIGARVTVELDNGATLTRTVQAGSGYLSSYSGPQHFGIPAGAKAASIKVRWPGGGEGTAEVSGDTVEVVQE
jgi:hypothetical protein